MRVIPNLPLSAGRLASESDLFDIIYTYACFMFLLVKLYGCKVLLEGNKISVKV